jgi:rhodanese-related sulfurtransferase
MSSLVSRIPAAGSAAALAHFEARLTFETDCWDVHQSMRSGDHDFMLADVRAAAAFAKEHVPGAISLPHATITEEAMRRFPRETLFVVHCAGPHCNGANRAAIRLAKLGFAVKEMIGGMSGWQCEGFATVQVASEQVPSGE